MQTPYNTVESSAPQVQQASPAQQMEVVVYHASARWFVNQGKDTIDHGVALSLEEVRSVQLTKQIARLVIHATFCRHEVEQAAHEYGWSIAEGGTALSNAQTSEPAPLFGGKQRSVIQDWVSDLPMMQQTVLLTAIRGPDGLRKESPAKPLLRAYRREILLSAMDGRVLANPSEAGGGSFTGPCHHPEGLAGVMIDFIRGVDEYPHHFLMHVIHAVEIVGYKHHDADKRNVWNAFYEALCKDAHMQPEQEFELDFRLGDNEAQWLKTQDTPLGAIVQ